MNKKQKEELKNFLIYLHLKTLDAYTITSEGYVAIFELLQKYPQFKDIKKENLKLFEMIDKL